MSGDGPDTQLPMDVSAFADQTVEFIIEALNEAAGGRGSVSVEPFQMNEMMSPLGNLLAASISTRLANADLPRIRVVEPGEEDYVVAGQIFASNLGSGKRRIITMNEGEEASRVMVRDPLRVNTSSLFKAWKKENNYTEEVI